MTTNRSLIGMIVAVGMAIMGCRTTGAQPPSVPAKPGKTTPTQPKKASAPPKTTALEKPLVRIETTLGNFVVELDPEKAPRTVVNFTDYVQAGFYNGTIFHRVIDGYVTQGGVFLPSMVEKKEGVRGPIQLESQNGLSNSRGSIAMARETAPNSATTQFYINIADNGTKLDYPQPDGFGYAVFGRVVEGMDIVDRIAKTPVSAHEKYANGLAPVVPVQPLVIKSMTMAKSFDRAKVKSFIDAQDRQVELDKQKEEEASKRWLSEFIVQTEKEIGGKFQKTESGLMFLDRKVGRGPSPALQDEVSVHFRGLLSSGKEIENSYTDASPRVYELGKVIVGWQEGMLGMKLGGIRVLIVPPQLAFGESGIPGRIPGDSTLIYEIELLDMK